MPFPDQGIRSTEFSLALVDIILSNNGFDVINLGIKQDVSAIIDAQKKHNADCIAMSGLLVKSTAFMKDNLEAFNNAEINVPVILGGAALTPKFVNEDCSQIYKGKILYLCTVTFGPKSLKLNSRPVYC